MRNTLDFDFSPLFRTTIGFDRLSRVLDAALRADEGAVSYPPYDIVQVGDEKYRISMAVAGFSQGDIEIALKEDTLTVKGARGQGAEESDSFLHRGIAARSFERRFQLADNIKVTGADLRDGLLHIELERQIPEEKKPRVIEIRSDSPQQIADQAA